MTEFYSSSSRLGRKRLKQAYLKALMAIVFSLLLILAIIYLGIPILIKLSGLFGNFRSSEPITTLDTTPPFPPRLEPINEATNSAEITVKGFSEPSSNLELFLNGESYKKVLVSNQGNFEINVSLQEGENRILTQATDDNKNVSQPSATIFVTYQKKATKLEISQPPNNAEIKDDRNIDIQGFTDPEASLTINDRYVIINQDGSFSFPYSLIDGDNILKIIATDEAGNKTTLERKVRFSP